MSTLFLIFNHQLTQLQEEDARASLGIRQITGLPPDLRDIWCQIPSHLHNISNYLEPLKNWLSSEASEGDCVLIQGDLGACFIMVRFASDKGLIPVCATTRREAAEETQADGSVKLTHQFKHQIFRKYGR